jgi:hypothetical protein
MRNGRRLPRTTTYVGIPAASDEYLLTAGPGGPILLQGAVAFWTKVDWELGGRVASGLGLSLRELDQSAVGS